MNCKIIRDLMILHIDNQASPESIDEIEKHIKDCDECRRIYEELLCECGHSDDPEKPAEEEEYKEKIFNPFAKIRFQFRLRIIIAIVITAVFIGAIGVYFFYGITPVNSEDVTITSEAVIYYEDTDADGEKEKQYEVLFHFSLKNKKCIDVRSKDFTADGIQEVTVYDQYRLPFDDRGKHPGRFDYGIGREAPFTDKEVFIVKFKDKTVEYNLKEIAEEAGIQ